MITAVRTSREVRLALRIVDPSHVTATLGFWQSQGVLAHAMNRDSRPNSTWTLLETSSSEQLSSSHATSSRDTATGLAAGSETLDILSEVDIEQTLSSLEPFWAFIQNALTNLHSLPASRLQSMMQALAPGYSGHTLQQLEVFLEAGRKQGALVRNKDSTWRLVQQ